METKSDLNVCEKQELIDIILRKNNELNEKDNKIKKLEEDLEISKNAYSFRIKQFNAANTKVNELTELLTLFITKIQNKL